MFFIPNQRNQDRAENAHQNHHQRNGNRYFYVYQLTQHFQSNEHQHGSNSLLQETEFMHSAAQKKKQRAETQHSKNIGSVNHQPVLGYPKYSRNGIQCKYDVCRSQQNNNDKQGSIKFPALYPQGQSAISIGGSQW